MELNTPVGPLDILMITPNGKLVIIETKLWRNPEARRKVVAQILDYAKELARWTYEDLQRELNRKLGSSGNILYNIACSSDESSDPGEAYFVDAVSRNLQKGEFLLLVVGDGIREGAEGLAEFLSTAGNLAFSFAMVELAVYEQQDIGKLILPRIIARTVELQRYVVELPPGFQIQESNDNSISPSPSLSPDQQKEKDFYPKFWRDFINQLNLDDPGQSIPDPANAQNQFFYLPPQKQAWISTYFMKSKKRVGVYFRCAKSQIGHEMAERLETDKEAILSELGENVIWDMLEEAGGVGVRLNIDDVFSSNSTQEIADFFSEWVNKYVNVFRPRLKRMSEELKS